MFMWRNLNQLTTPFALSLTKGLFMLSSASTSSARTAYLALFLFALGTAPAQAQLPNLGREATPAEIAAWNIDVRSDFRGLPKGAGSVAQGNEVWDAKCASCHGVFGESNAVFPPLVGGITKEDMAKGRVAGMVNGTAPYRTTLMKVSQLSTLWDYINRAMPWTAPKSLSTEEVYAVTAYILNLGGIVPDDFTLSDKNIAQVQATMPNRNGKTTQHGLWHVTGKGDTHNTACMKDCTEGKISSTMPDYARNAHGNLAEQNRIFGPYRGIDTTLPSITSVVAVGTKVDNSSSRTPVVASPAALPLSTLSSAAIATKTEVDVKPLLSKHACTGCHAINNKIVGPSFAEISKKYPGKIDYLANKIKVGGQGVWGAIPMPAQALPASDAQTIANWLSRGMK
jgi:S-disulfanyl-L-cysteine oxidoreductase SoxD